MCRRSGASAPGSGVRRIRSPWVLALPSPSGERSHAQAHSFDKYNRTIGDVILPDGMSLNQELVKDGWCW